MNKRLLMLILLFQSVSAVAERPVFSLTIEKHLFYPSELIIPAKTKIKLIINNLDSTPEQFDSFDLNREKVIFPKTTATIFIGPLTKGEYNFFGEFHPNSALGKIIAVEDP